MSLKVNMLPPSVNNMSVRVFVRAAGLPYEEENVWGQTQGDDVSREVPGRADADGRDGRAPEGRPRGELRGDDVSREPRRARRPLPDRSRAPRDDRQRELLHDEHALPARRARDLSAPELRRATRAKSRPRRRRTTTRKAPARRRRTRSRASSRPTASSSAPTEASSAAADPSIADIRLACTLEFLAVTDTELAGLDEGVHATGRVRARRGVHANRRATCATTSRRSQARRSRRKCDHTRGIR